MESSVLPSEIILILALSQPIVLPHSLITKILHRKECSFRMQVTVTTESMAHFLNTCKHKDEHQLGLHMTVTDVTNNRTNSRSA